MQVSCRYWKEKVNSEHVSVFWTNWIRMAHQAIFAIDHHYHVCHVCSCGGICSCNSVSFLNSCPKMSMMWILSFLRSFIIFSFSMPILPVLRQLLLIRPRWQLTWMTFLAWSDKLFPSSENTSRTNSCLFGDPRTCLVTREINALRTGSSSTTACEIPSNRWSTFDSNLTVTLSRTGFLPSGSLSAPIGAVSWRCQSCVKIPLHRPVQTSSQTNKLRYATLRIIFCMGFSSADSFRIETYQEEYSSSQRLWVNADPTWKM